MSYDTYIALEKNEICYAYNPNCKRLPVEKPCKHKAKPEITQIAVRISEELYRIILKLPKCSKITNL